MSVSAAERKFLKKMGTVAGKEAKKYGLKPLRFSGAYAGDSLIFELEFEPSLENMNPEGHA